MQTAVYMGKEKGMLSRLKFFLYFHTLYWLMRGASLHASCLLKSAYRESCYVCTAEMPWWKILWLAVLAGIYLSFGCALDYYVGGQLPQITESVLPLI